VRSNCVEWRLASIEAQYSALLRPTMNEGRERALSRDQIVRSMIGFAIRQCAASGVR
jgi:hypothetical protein